jgi:hypothetical protein
MHVSSLRNYYQCKKIYYIIYFAHKQSEMYVKPADAHNLLRPETAESLFILYRLTKVLVLFCL